MLVQAGSESYANAVLLHYGSFVNNTWATATSLKTKALVRGPAIIDQAWLPTTDALGSAFNMTTLATAMLGLNPPIITATELTPTVTLTT